MAIEVQSLKFERGSRRRYFVDRDGELPEAFSRPEDGGNWLFFVEGGRVGAYGEGFDEGPVTFGTVALTFYQVRPGFYEALISQDVRRELLIFGGVDPDEIKDVAITDIEKADQEYRRMRKGYWTWRRGRNPSFDVRRYFWLRQNRRTAKNWRAQKDDYYNQYKESFDDATAWVGKWRSFLTWFNEQRPTEEEFIKHNGGKNDSLWRSTNGIFDMFAERMESRIEVVEGQLAVVDETDEDFGFIEEIEAAADKLGLEPIEEWNDQDDGFVWFVKPDTGKRYFVQLYGWSFIFDVLTHFNIDRDGRYADRWEEATNNSLLETIITVCKENTRHAPDRVLRDYFGAYDGIRYWVNRNRSTAPVPFNDKRPR